ncbi:PAS domain-containing sensor histidine kinase [Gloeocapsopsis sp. IPPAS B-1203]|nr:PAS domain-containing sensor histidine kinase [Gloeocapsopsis sp. IPPAS B-1203]
MLWMLRFSRDLTANLNPHRSLKARFGLAIGVIAFLLSILASLIVGYTASEQIKVNVGQSLAELAYQMTDKLDRGMFERYRDLQIVSTLNIIRNPNSNLLEQRTLLEKLQSTYPKYAWIGLTDNQGIVQASTGKLLEGVSVAQRPWFIGGQQAPYVGDVHEALKLAKLLPSPSNEPLRFVDVAAPVVDLQGNPRGVLGAHLSWTWSQEVQKSLLRSLQSRNTEMFVLREDGSELLGPPGFNAQPQADNLPAEPLPLMSVKEAQRGLNSYRIETWLDGHTYLTGFARSSGYRDYPGLGWLVLVRQRTDVAFAPARQLQHQIFAWNVTLGVLFAILGWVIAEHITKPMLAIAAAADRIRQGNTRLNIPVVQGRDEVANLSKSLNKLVSTLTLQENDLKISNQQLQMKICELQEAEESVRSSEEKFRQLAENIQEVFWISDPDVNEIIYISPAYEQIWGKTCESLYANPNSWLDAVYPEDRKHVFPKDRKTTYGTYNVEFRLVQPNGSVRWLWTRTFPVHNPKGEVYRIVGLTQDITERKQAQETRQELAQEKELSELKSRFIAHTSHEFRTPLTAIKMSATMLEKFDRKASVEQKNRYFDQIQTGVKRLTQLLDNILIISKAEAGKLEFNPTVLNLVDFCHSLIEELHLGTGDQRQITFISQGYCNQTCLDETLLRYILTNLLSNAIKYSPQGGNIQLDLICDEETAIFRVQDCGIGIPVADQANLFTSFYRCSNTGKLPGTGLGLVIVKDAVDLHGGQITVESEVGVGTTFTVTLPLNYTPTTETS